MTYYLASFDQEKFREFQKRMPFLATGLWLDKISELQKILDSKPDSPVFLFHLKDLKDEKFHDFVLYIKALQPDAKIVYVTEVLDHQSLKAHQSGQLGGNAYVPVKITAEVMKQVLNDLGIVKEEEGESLSGVTKIAKISDEDGKTFELEGLKKLQDDPLSKQMDKLFKTQKKEPQVEAKPVAGASMSNNDQELSLDDLGELELSSDAPEQSSSVDDGSIDLNLDEGLELNLGDDSSPESTPSLPNEISSGGLELPNVPSSASQSMGNMDFTDVDEVSLSSASLPDLNLGDADLDNDSLSLTDDEDVPPLDLSGDSTVIKTSSKKEEEPEEELLSLSDDEPEEEEKGTQLTIEAHKKLKEIDALMSLDSSEADIGTRLNLSELDRNDEVEDVMNESLVSDDIVDSLNIQEEVTVTKDLEDFDEIEEIEEKPKRKRKSERELGSDLREISGAYSGELERTQATISNLRSDREELLKMIQKLEEDKVLQNRQFLTMRAELDEKKIELSIIRKKLNEEINDLKDKLRVQEERKLILEEKNRLLSQELDKAGQRNKIDVKKVQIRERDLEQKLELLKADAETQIRNRDLKILELKRKIDSMEFDMESIGAQEQKSVESRYELEDKLGKAIKTLRTAISVLEDESDKSSVLEALKKNIDM